MNPDIDQISITAFVLTFIGGVVTGFNPCCYTMVPAIVGYLGGYCEPSVKRCSWLSGWFALGVATATALLGLVVVLVGGFFGGGASSRSLRPRAGSDLDGPPSPGRDQH